MKAQVTELKIDEVLSKVRSSLAKKIEYSIDLIRKRFDKFYADEFMQSKIDFDI